MTPQNVARKWAEFQDDRRVELVSFRASEKVMQKLDALQREYPHVPRSVMLHDLIGMGLVCYAALQSNNPGARSRQRG